MIDGSSLIAVGKYAESWILECLKFLDHWWWSVWESDGNGKDKKDRSRVFSLLLLTPVEATKGVENIDTGQVSGDDGVDLEQKRRWVP